MTVNWSLIGDLEVPISEISYHALSHSKVKGYDFSNAPTEGRIREEWRSIMLTGGPLHNHWASSGETIHSSYIMAPFFDSFIFISPAPKTSGGRPALEIHSMICDESEHLVHEALRDVKGPRIPPLSSVSLEPLPKVIEVVSDLGLRVGLSSWLFQLRKFRPVTGVACGVPKEILNKLFPNVSRWILETEGTPSEVASESDALHQMLHATDPSHIQDTLYDFRLLEEFSSEFDIELRTLMPIHMCETHEHAKNYWPEREIIAICQVTPADEMKARLILGDREDSLKILIKNPNLAPQWMKGSRTNYPFAGLSNATNSRVIFPFTEDEVILLIERLPSHVFGLLKVCASKMSDDYPTESKICMATILTMLGGQDEIEDIWKTIAPIGREWMEKIKPKILDWRDNNRIDDFWGLLDDLEGESSKGHLWRREMALGVLSNSSKPEDISGVVEYIPSIISIKKYYQKDWAILDQIGLTSNSTLLAVNQLQPKGDKIQQRLKLYFEHKGIPRTKWRISSTANSNGLIPISHSHLVNNQAWMKPILVPIGRQTAYEATMPEDAFFWMQDLSPREYLECLNDKVMSKYLKSKRRNFNPNYSNGWKKPRALSSNLTPSHIIGDKWKICQTWARLIEQPTLGNKFAYYKGSLAWIVGFISILAMSYCVLITTPTVHSIGGQNWQGVLMTSLAIILGWAGEKVRSHLYNDGSEASNIWGFAMAVISLFFISLISILLWKSMDLTVGSLIESYHLTLALGNLGIYPIPDFITVLTLNPFTTLLIVPIFWQMNRVMMNTHSRGVEMKQQFHEIIGSLRKKDVRDYRIKG